MVDFVSSYPKPQNILGIQGSDLCSSWKQLNTALPGQTPTYAPYQFTSLVADYIRTQTVTEACTEAMVCIMDAVNRRLVWGSLENEPYDRSCVPSWIIRNRIASYSGTQNDCSGNDIDPVYSGSIENVLGASI